MTVDPFEADVDPVGELEMSDDDRRDFEAARAWRPEVPPLGFRPFDPDRLDEIRGQITNMRDHHAHDAELHAVVERSRAGRNGETEATEPPPDDEPPEDPDELDESWRRVDLAGVLRGEFHEIIPTVLRREDGRALFYRGHTNGTHSDSGIGKTWIATIAAAQEMHVGSRVLWVDLENPGPEIVLDRLRRLGVPDDLILAHLDYRRPSEPFTRHVVDDLEQAVTEDNASLVVVDSLGEAFALAGLDENKDVEVGPWMRSVARRLEATGAAVLLIDHSTKAADNPLHPSGSKRKRAAITGASYLIEAPKPLTKEHGGRLRLVSAKDRHGQYPRGQIVAEIEFTVYPDGGLTVHVWPPSSSAGDTPDARLDTIARAAIRATKDAGHSIGRNELEVLMDVKAGASLKRAAIDRAVDLGAIRTEPGPRRAVMHFYVRDLDTVTEP